MEPEQRYGRQYLVLREPLFVTSTIKDEVGLWIRHDSKVVVDEIIFECQQFGIPISSRWDLSRMSSGQRVIIAIMTASAICADLDLFANVLIIDVGKFLSDAWKRKIRDWSGSRPHIELCAIDLNGDRVAF